MIGPDRKPQENLGDGHRTTYGNDRDFQLQTEPIIEQAGRQVEPKRRRRAWMTTEGNQVDRPSS